MSRDVGYPHLVRAESPPSLFLRSYPALSLRGREGSAPRLVTPTQLSVAPTPCCLTTSSISVIESTSQETISAQGLSGCSSSVL